MKNSIILLAALAAVVNLPAAAHAADQSKGKSSFAAADTDGDGKISAREYTAATKGQMDAAAAKAKFAELDKNKDGALSSEEFNGATGKKRTRKKKEMADN